MSSIEVHRTHLLSGASRLLTLALLTFGAAHSPGQEAKEWQDPKLTGVNNEPPHATMVICPDAKTAQSIRWANNAERVKSSFYRSLNGDWKYHYATNHAGRVAGLLETGVRRQRVGYSPCALKRGNARLRHSDLRQHPAIPGPATGCGPILPSCRRTIPTTPSTPTGAPSRCPTEWEGRHVFLTFDGVNSFFFLWINGQKVGLGKDSRTPVEFDITKYLRARREPASPSRISAGATVPTLRTRISGA